MRFTMIRMKNYRQYRDVTFDFTKETPYDLHVLIAVNGAGKTNLLNALNWCIYGDEPHVAGTEEEGLPENTDKLILANKYALQEARSEGERYCQAEVYIEGEEADIKYTFKRQADFDVEALSQHGRDRFEVREYLPSGTTNIYGTDDHTEASYNEICDMLLPKSIREYFFFDGDQLLDYFGNNSAAAKVSHLKNCIYEISQVSVVENTKEHLKDLEHDVSKKVKKVSPNLQGASDELEKAGNLCIAREKEMEKLDDQLSKARASLAAIDKYLAGTEHILEDSRQLDDNTAEIKELDAECKEKMAELAKLISRYFDRFMLYDINKDNEAYIKDRLSEGNASAVNVNIEEMKHSLEHDYKCALCGEPLKPDRIKKFQDFVDRYESNTSIQTLSAMQSDLCRGLDISSYADEKKRLTESIRKKKARIQTLTDTNEILYSRINMAPSGIKGLNDLGDQKKQFSNLIEKNTITLGKYEQQLADLREKEEEAKEKYREALEKNRECRELARRQAFLQKSINILSDVIDGIVDNVKKQMEERTFEIFQRFVWDADRFDHIELDEYFRLKIFDADTGQSCLRTCSAGEKELLALAFTLAIHEVSGYDNLLFIDTPVGRLSGVNRSNFASVLKDISKNKQIILAFTDTEFSVEVADVFTENVLSSKVTLDGKLLETKKKGGEG